MLGTDTTAHPVRIVTGMGETLPKDYEGCEDESGAYAAAVWVTCDDPAMEFTSYEDELFAKRGDTITSDPAAIKKLRADCQA